MATGFRFLLNVVEVEAELGDILDMAKKRFDGKILKARGSSGGIGVIASVVPASGKTFYPAKASCLFNKTNFTNDEVGGIGHATLRNDASIIDDAHASLTQGHLGFDDFGTGGHSKTDFIISGADSLDGDGVKAYDINVTINGESTNAFGTLIGFIENTGDDPSA